jgi:uncharacterized protein
MMNLPISLNKNKIYSAMIASGMAIFMQIPAANASSPSFDCAKAKYADEQAICSSDDLASLDIESSNAYLSLKQSIGKSAANKIARPILRERRACGSDIECIRNNTLTAIDTYKQNNTTQQYSGETSTTQTDTTYTNQSPAKFSSTEGFPLELRLIGSIIAALIVSGMISSFWAEMSRSEYENFTTNQLEKISKDVPVMLKSFPICLMLFLGLSSAITMH